MHTTEQLIKRFWEGTTTAEEEQLLLTLLNEVEAGQQEALRLAFQERKEAGELVVKEDRTNHILARLHAQINTAEEATPASSGKLIFLQRRQTWWIAAAAIALLVVGVYAWQHLTPAQPVMVQHKPVLRSVINKADTSIIVPLADGSVVSLNGHSALSYYDSFSNTSRNISLAGEATFKVAKDSTRPFTVFSKGIATTALGTVFTVNTHLLNTVNVKLLEGKVVIRSANGNKGLVMNKVYLTPGQEFTINQLNNQYLVNNTTADKAVIADARSNIHHKTEQLSEGRALAFNNEPLANVFRQLEKKYQVKIRFETGDMAGLYFSGKVLQEDSLSIVLSAICNSNQLSYSRQQDQIQISK